MSTPASAENVAHFTTNVVIYRQPIFTRSWAANILIENLRFYQQKYAFRLIGYLIMPDHLHSIVWPQPGTAIGAIMRDFKKFAAVAIIEALNQHLGTSPQAEAATAGPPSVWRQNQAVPAPADMLSAFAYAGRHFRKTRHKIWQGDFYSTVLWSPNVMRQKLRYIHNNPMRWGLVDRPEDWLYSSYRALELGETGPLTLDASWAL